MKITTDFIKEESRVELNIKTEKLNLPSKKTLFVSLSELIVSSLHKLDDLDISLIAIIIGDLRFYDIQEL